MIFVGVDVEGKVVKLEDSGIGHLSIHGEVLDINEIFDESDGEEQARDILEDGDMWRDAVASGNTEEGLDSWIDDTIACEGWEEIVGDVNDIGDGRWCKTDESGQISIDRKWAILLITTEELSLITKA